MYSKKVEKEFNVIFKSLEKAQSKVINSIEYLDKYLEGNPLISRDEIGIIEDFMVLLDITRIDIKKNISMYKKYKLEQNEKVLFLPSKEIDDIYIESGCTIWDFF